MSLNPGQFKPTWGVEWFRDSSGKQTPPPPGGDEKLAKPTPASRKPADGPKDPA